MYRFITIRICVVEARRRGDGGMRFKALDRLSGEPFVLSIITIHQRTSIRVSRTTRTRRSYYVVASFPTGLIATAQTLEQTEKKPNIAPTRFLCGFAKVSCCTHTISRSSLTLRVARKNVSTTSPNGRPRGHKLECVFRAEQLTTFRRGSSTVASAPNDQGSVLRRT